MSDASSASRIILVHGLWMSGLQLGVLGRRLQAATGYAVDRFSYPTVAGSMSDHVRRLIDFARAQQAHRLHFVAHSLGGLVVLRALQRTDELPPGRAVLLGTPLQGSRAAQSVARAVPFGKAILGAAVNEECIDGPLHEWTGHRDIGVIAGSLGLGLGRLFARLDGEHDGTIMVEETRLPGAKDHVIVRTSHTGMLLSHEVVRQAGHFLREGRFIHA